MNVMDEEKTSNESYNYGENKIWCNGKCISGKKYYYLFFTFLFYSIPFLMLLIILFKIKNISSFIFTKIFLFTLYFLETYSSFRSGFTDPGIIPRQKDDQAIPIKKSQGKCVIRGHLFNLNYCTTCNLFKPPRSSHCLLCNNCIQKRDHHCMWLGDCIGKRNYKFFYLFIFSFMIGIIYQISFCIYILLSTIIKGKYDKFITLAIIITMSFIVFYDVSFLILFFFKLFCFHSFFCIQNLTAYEYNKNKKLFGFNPFNKNFCYNFKNIFCKKERKTYIFDTPSEINKITTNTIIYNVKVIQVRETTENSLNADNSNMKNLNSENKLN